MAWICLWALSFQTEMKNNTPHNQTCGYVTATSYFLYIRLELDLHQVLVLSLLFLKDLGLALDIPGVPEKTPDF